MSTIPQRARRTAGLADFEQRDHLIYGETAALRPQIRSPTLYEVHDAFDLFKRGIEPFVSGSLSLRAASFQRPMDGDLDRCDTLDRPRFKIMGCSKQHACLHCRVTLASASPVVVRPTLMGYLPSFLIVAFI
jgi:hypothetical protein